MIFITKLYVLSFILTLLMIDFAASAKINKANKKPLSICKSEKADHSILKLGMVEDETFDFPTNLDEMKTMCKKAKPHETYLKEYANKCLDKTAKQTLSIIMFSVVKANKKICSNQRKKEDFLTLSKCLKIHKNVTAVMLQSIARDYHSLKIHKPVNQRIPIACCSYYKYRNEVTDYIEGKCGEKPANEFTNLLSLYLTDVLNALCGDYTDDSDKCDSVYPKLNKWTKPVEWKSFLIPMVEFMNDI